MNDEVEVEDKNVCKFTLAKVEETSPTDVDWDSYLSEYNTETTSTPFEERELPRTQSRNYSPFNQYGKNRWFYWGWGQ